MSDMTPPEAIRAEAQRHAAERIAATCYVIQNVPRPWTDDVLQSLGLIRDPDQDRRDALHAAVRRARKVRA